MVSGPLSEQRIDHMAKKKQLPRDDTARRRNLLMNVLYPICRTIGNILRMDGEKIDDYFIERNNRIVASTSRRYRPEELLLVFPHCLQDWECRHRINADIHNCRACGNCDIPQLIELGDRYKVAMSLVGGGTAARRAVYDHMPRLTIAVACERDMISGIRDAMPLPLWGILNERPNGPCRNTKVNVARVEETLKMLLDGR
jgi:hypothetical protein